MFTFKIIVLVLIYLLCFIKNKTYPLKWKKVLLIINISMLCCLCLNLFLYYNFSISFRGDTISFFNFYICFFSAVLLFSMYRKKLGKILWECTFIWVIYTF